MIKLNKDLEKLLLLYAGDNVGENCKCPMCEENRDVLRKAIATELNKAREERLSEMNIEELEKLRDDVQEAIDDEYGAMADSL